MHVALHGLLLQVAPDPSKSLTIDTPVGQLPVVADARWSQGFTHASWGALLVWLLLLLVLQVATWPLVRRLFARFPDRGWGFARLLSLLTAAYLVWLLASLPVIAFRAVWCGVALLVVAALAWGVGRWLGGGTELWRPWQNRTLVVGELVFWGLFLLFLVFRLLNPDSYHPIWGGEKPMEFAHINAILRSAHFPPEDPWYAGGYINYYYYGEYLVAYLIKLTGIPMEVAFNLAQPTTIALLGSGAYSVGAALGKHLVRRRLGSITTGLLSVLLLLLIGNLVEMSRLVEGWLHGTPLGDAFSYWFWAPSRAVPSAITQIGITEFPYFTATYADLHAHVVALPITVLVIGLVYSLVLEWRESVVALSLPRVETRLVLGAVVRLGVLALVLATLWPTNAWDVPMYVVLSGIGLLMATKGLASLWRRLVVSAVAMTIVGGLAYLMILPFTTHYAALFSAVKTRDADTPLVSVESHFGVFLAIVFIGFMVLLGECGRLPRLLALPGAGGGAVLIVLLARWWATDHGTSSVRITDALTVLLIVGVLAAAFVAAAPSRCDFRLPGWLPRLIVAAGMVATVVLVAIDRPVPALYFGLGILGVGLWLALTDVSERFLAAMIAGGMLLGAALEYFYLQDDLWNTPWYRMNTVFKFYNELWVLFALSSAGLVARMALRAITAPADFRATAFVPVSGAEPVDIASSDEEPGRGEPGEASARPAVVRPSRRGGTPFGWAAAGVLVSAILIVAALAYPLNATRYRLDQHFAGDRGGLTLDSFNWMNYGTIQYADGSTVGYKDDRAAIDWFNDHVKGTPVIAEASFGPYRCNGSRFSIATGLPDIVGWVRHEQQQRYDTDGILEQRQAQMQALYQSTDVNQKKQILAEYQVKYVIVGQTEREYPSISGNDCIPVPGIADGIAALEGMVGTNLKVAFQSGTTTVYEVISTN